MSPLFIRTTLLLRRVVGFPLMALAACAGTSIGGWLIVCSVASLGEASALTVCAVSFSLAGVFICATAAAVMAIACALNPFTD